MDRYGRKSAFLTLYTGFLLGTLFCGLSIGYAMLLVARVVTGAFGGILGGMALAIIADVFPEERRGRATGILMSAFAAASVDGRANRDLSRRQARLARSVPGSGGSGSARVDHRPHASCRRCATISTRRRMLTRGRRSSKPSATRITCAPSLSRSRSCSAAFR